MNMHLTKEIVFSLLLITMITLAVIVAGLATNLLFSGVLWFLDGEFDMTWQRALHTTKLGFFGGGILGIGMVFIRFLKIKGF